MGINQVSSNQIRGVDVTPTSAIDSLARDLNSTEVKLLSEIRSSLNHEYILADKGLAGLKASELRCQDRNGVSVLEHLHAVAASNPRDAMQLVYVLQSFGGSTQDNHATCATESISFLLDQSNVGEWVRIARELKESGSAELHDPETGALTTMTVPKDAFWPDKSGRRGSFDRVMQASIKNLVAPLGTTYSNKYDQFICSSTGEGRGNGLDDAQAAKALTLLTGTVHKEVCDRHNLKTVLEKFDDSPLYAALKWAGEGEEHASHAVVITEVKENRVYFRNPWGPCEDRNGTELEDPPRRVEDNKIGLESMDQAQFLKLLDGVVISQERLNSMHWNTPLSEASITMPRSGSV